jgi:two-component system response regulator NreC
MRDSSHLKELTGCTHAATPIHLRCLQAMTKKKGRSQMHTTLAHQAAHRSNHRPGASLVPAKRHRLALVDDQMLFRQGLRALMNTQADFDVVADAGSGGEAVHLVQAHDVDLAVIEVCLPDLDGVRTAERILSSRPATRIVVLTRTAQQGYMRRMLDAGVKGYVLKHNGSAALFDAIRIVLLGGSAIDPQLRGRRSECVAAWRTAGSFEAISKREAEVLRCIAWGLSTKEVAANLGIAVKTVESYRATASDKLGLRSRADILRFAFSNSWLAEAPPFQ